MKLDYSLPIYQKSSLFSVTLNLKITTGQEIRDKADFLRAGMSYLPPTWEGMRVTAGLNQTSGSAAGKQDLNTWNRGKLFPCFMTREGIWKEGYF